MRNSKSMLSLLLILSAGSVQASSINSADFINCFETAFNERINELKEKYKGKDIGICDQMSEEAKIKLINLYSETTEDGGRAYYSAESMGAENVRFHYERLMHEIPCYETPKFIGTAFVKGFGNAIGVYEHTPFQLVEDTFTKILGRPMWSENGSDKFSEHTFDYCKNTPNQE